MDVHEDQDYPQERVKNGHRQQARAVLNQCAKLRFLKES